MRKKHILILTGSATLGFVLASCGADKKPLKENEGHSSNLRAAIDEKNRRIEIVLNGQDLYQLMEVERDQEAETRGRQTEKTDPFPSLLSTLTVPPWACTIAFTRAKPRPSPA